MKHIKMLLVFMIIPIAVIAIFLMQFKGTVTIKEYTDVPRPPRISPDYTGTVIPPNIAPLNFSVNEEGRQYYVKLYSKEGKTIEISSYSPKIIIPLKQWRKLLMANRGNKVYAEVFVRNKDDNWKRYQVITNTIANHNIDSHVAYRLMKTIYNEWLSVGVYQYNLENFKQSVVLHSKSFEYGCVNCHSFLNNRPDNMVIGVRSAKYGSSAIHTHDGKIEKVGTTFGHTTWHPSGRLTAYSFYDVRQCFHTARAEVRDVLELDSAILYYSFDDNSTKIIPGLCDKQELETHPAWSPDGRYLYFSSAPKLWEDDKEFPPKRFRELQYDLKRISYDIEKDQWGQVETVLSSSETGMSIIVPRVSPDGRFIICAMCKYSCFALFQPDSDLYLIDVKTGEYRNLENINSNQAESWHSFSSNSRWLVFSSKRSEGTFTRLYFCYIDEAGNFFKPFILPQKDPEFYDSFIDLYNVPEFVTGPVKVSKAAISRAVTSSKKIEVDFPLTGATPVPKGGEPWRQGRRE